MNIKFPGPNLEEIHNPLHFVLPLLSFLPRKSKETVQEKIIGQKDLREASLKGIHVQMDFIEQKYQPALE